MAKEGKKHGLPRKSKWLIEYLLAGFATIIVRFIPFSAALGLGGFLGTLAFKIDKRHQMVTLDNLRNSFKDKSDEEIRAIARGVYRNLGYSAVEFIRSGRYAKRPHGEYFDFVNYDAFRKALDKGKGVLLLTGHCGSWELLALAQSIRKPPIWVVARPLENPYLEKAVAGIRTRFGNRLINKNRGMREIIRTLDGGGAVGILLDQNVAKKEGVFVDFFGRPACTNKGLALLAAKTGAPVIPCFIRRVGRDRHEVIVGDEIPLMETGDKESDIKTNTEAYTRAIEGFVREDPEQWFWMHRRWKTRPEEV